MTRRDYVDLAAAFRTTRDCAETARVQWIRDVRAVCDVLERDPNFDRTRFYFAAGIAD